MEELALIDIWKDEQSVNIASQERRKEKRLGTHRCRRCCPGQRWCIRARRCSGWSPELWCNVTDGRGRRRLRPAAWRQQRPLTCLSWWWRLGKRVQGEGTFPYSTCLHTAVVKWKGPPAEGLWKPWRLPLVSVFDCEFAAYMLAGGSDRWVQTSLYHTRRRTGWLHPHTSLRSGTGRKHTRWYLTEKRKAEWLR